jgi:hypothetical protein
MYFKEIIAFHSKNDMEHVNTPCETNIKHIGIIYIKMFISYFSQHNNLYKVYRWPIYMKVIYLR